MVEYFAAKITADVLELHLYKDSNEQSAK